MSKVDYGNKYYNNSKGKTPGCNPAVCGNLPAMDHVDPKQTGIEGMNVLPNCTGYAIGRFNEIIGKGNCKYYFGAGNANTFYKNASKYGCESGPTPQAGAIICWDKQGSAGHVAVVENVSADGKTITISESGWSYPSSSPVGTYTLNYGTGNWSTGKNSNGKSYWMDSSKYSFQGFIYNPILVPPNNPGPTWPTNTDTSRGGAYTEQQAQQIVYETKTADITHAVVRTADYSGSLNKTKTTNLLSYPSLVESPFVMVKIGNYTFGTYSAEAYGSGVKIDYPNYVTSLNVVKINGSVNQYTINFVYQIRKGDDPNLLDKVFSSVGYKTIKISYGDWQSPTFIFREEEALITKLTSNVDFYNSRISYTLQCTSTALGLLGSSHYFPPRHAKPSDVIKEVFKNSKYGLSDIFYGMNAQDLNSLIAGDDKAVDIFEKASMDSLSYLNYLVTCMISQTNSDTDVLLDSSYHLTIHDDKYGDDVGGPYFKVTKVNSTSKTLSNYDTYEVDIGYPSDNLVTEFSISNDNSWALLYGYSGATAQQNYVYNIDNSGRIIKEYSPDTTTSATSFITTPSQKTWWTNMTKFPVQAQLVIKGLVRPAMLMTYIRINAMFYGQRHISSGIYFVTKQLDKVDSSGYRTILTLTRFAGDDDYIKLLKEKVTYQVAKTVVQDVVDRNDLTVIEGDDGYYTTTVNGVNDKTWVSSESTSGLYAPSGTTYYKLGGIGGREGTHLTAKGKLSSKAAIIMMTEDGTKGQIMVDNKTYYVKAADIIDVGLHRNYTEDTAKIGGRAAR